MLRPFPDRENTRVRDLVDIVILAEHDLILPALAGRERSTKVWTERNGTAPARSGRANREATAAMRRKIAAAHDLSATTFTAAVALTAQLWASAFAQQQT